MDLTLRAFEGASRRPSRLRRSAASFGLMTCISAAVSTFASASAHAAHPHHASHKTTALHPALIKVSTAKLRATPDTHGKTTALLDEGRSAVVIARKSGFVKVRLDSGREGWIRHDLVDVAKSTVHDDSSNDDSRSSRHHHKSETADSDESSSRSRRHRVTEIAVAPKRERKHSVQVAEAHTHVSHVSAEHVAEHSHVVTALVVGDSQVQHSSEDADGNDSRVATTLANGESALVDSNGEPLEAISPAARTRGERVVDKALAYRGTPYRMGATGNGAFDCSGFTMYLFGKEGSSLPRTAAEQFDRGTPVAKDHLQLGDLVFFQNTYKSGISHVGIYIGNNSFVHASGVGRGVRVDKLTDAFYINHWAGARRPR